MFRPPTMPRDNILSSELDALFAKIVQAFLEIMSLATK